MVVTLEMLQRFASEIEWQVGPDLKWQTYHHQAPLRDDRVGEGLKPGLLEEMTQEG